MLYPLGSTALGCTGVTAEAPGSQGERSVMLFVLCRRKLGLGSTLLANGHGSTRQTRPCPAPVAQFLVLWAPLLIALL